MRPTDRGYHGYLRNCLVLLCTAAAPARAHQLLLTRGVLVVGPDTIEIRLETAAEDQFHWDDVRLGDRRQIARPLFTEAAERHADRIDSALAIYCSDGARLDLECRLNPIDWPAAELLGPTELLTLRAMYNCRVELPPSQPFLVLRVQPDALPIRMPWQIVLSVEGLTEQVGKTIQLTSRGNVEVLELSSSAAREQPDRRGLCGCDAQGEARFKEPCADVRLGPDVVDLTLSMPLTLLQTWFTMAVDGNDYLDPAHTGDALRAARELVRRNIRLMPESVASFQSMNAEFASFAEGIAAPRLSLWTTRLRATVRFKLDDSKPPTLTWGLFNSTVLSTHVFVVVGEVCTEHLLTTYEPTVVLGRGLKTESK